MIKIAISLRIHPPKRRTGQQRLKAKLYYRKNRARIQMQRKRYMRMHKSQLKHRKQFKRFKPSWFKKPSRPTQHKYKKFKLTVPKQIKPTKVFTPFKPKKSRP